MTRTNTFRCRGRLRSSTSGFTLVEILMALVVVLLLLALLVPALSSGLKAGKRAQVKAEISSLASALASFKTKYGDYPPSRIYLSENGYFPINGTDSVAVTMSPTSNAALSDAALYDIPIGQLVQRSVAAMRKFFPKVNVSTSGPVFPAGSTQWYDFNGNGTFDGPYILQGHECLVFFLGGIPLYSSNTYSMTGFGSNPSNPFTNSIVSSGATYGANRQAPFYEFNASRLILDPNNPTNPGIPGYYDSLGNDFPTSSSPSGLNFFAYFSTTGLGGGYDPNDVNFLATEDDGHLVFYGQNSSGTTLNDKNAAGSNPISPAPNPYTSSTTFPSSGTVSYINPQSFQIISAGLDGLYGIGGQYSPPPAAAALPVDIANILPPNPWTTNPNPNPNIEPVQPGTIRNREKDNITNFGSTSQLD